MSVRQILCRNRVIVDSQTGQIRRRLEKAARCTIALVAVSVTSCVWVGSAEGQITVWETKALTSLSGSGGSAIGPKQIRSLRPAEYSDHLMFHKGQVWMAANGSICVLNAVVRNFVIVQYAKYLHFVYLLFRPTRRWHHGRRTRIASAACLCMKMC